VGALLALAAFGSPATASAASIFDIFDTPFSQEAPRPPAAIPDAPSSPRGWGTGLEGSPSASHWSARPAAHPSYRPGSVTSAPLGPPLDLRPPAAIPLGAPSQSRDLPAAVKAGGHERAASVAPDTSVEVSLPLSSEPLPAHPSTLDLERRPFQPGDRGEAVRHLQEGLALLYPVPISGQYDPPTEDAVKDFQRAEGLQVSGRVGHTTYATLWQKVFWTKHVAMDLNGSDYYDSLPPDRRLSVDIASQRVQVVNAADGSVLRTFPIASGADGYPTPRGHFKITEIRERPTWTPPASNWARRAHVTPAGPENPLGPVKMRLNGLPILFHGVPRSEYSSIGRKAASHGCMRMFPQDAWELHHLIRSGTPVEIH
jgi:lipoprotein-anchoring transpeptidase ErfK/SrfK